LKEHHKITDASLLFNNLIIIDCFTPLSLKISKSMKYKELLINYFSMLVPDKLKKRIPDKGYLLTDPRDSHLLNEQYNKSLCPKI
jgi:hypothetical protein